MERIKAIAGAFFFASFLLAIFLFTALGRNLLSQVLSIEFAQNIFFLFGAIAILLNLISFQYSKGSIYANFIFWMGAILILAGIILKIKLFPFAIYFILLGLSFVIFGWFFSFIKTRRNKKDERDIIDNRFNQP
jgi:hypothetical protein